MRSRNEHFSGNLQRCRPEILLVVYLTLSAHYESFALPFIILLAVPTAVLGALLFISMRGLVNDVYLQIGLVMLVGLSAKNSILIVEFAEQLLEQVRSIIDDFDDVVRLLSRRPAALLRDWRRQARSTFCGHGDCRRNVVLHNPQPVLHPSTLCNRQSLADFDFLKKE